MTSNTIELTDDDKVRIANNTERILALLQRGPKTSDELIQVTHRFSACVKTLRERGYVIAVEVRDGGQSLHTLVIYTPMVRVTDAMKDAYYKTAHWQEARRQRLALDGYQCCHCHCRGNLHVHHWHYDLFNEAIEDLMTLCERCHDGIHSYESVKVHFPHSVTEAIAKRICETPQSDMSVLF